MKTSIQEMIKVVSALHTVLGERKLLDYSKQKKGIKKQKFIGRNIKRKGNTICLLKGGLISMKVKCVEKFDYVVEPFIEGKIYDVISIENGWYRIVCELGEDYLFPPHIFEIVEE